MHLVTPGWSRAHAAEHQEREYERVGAGRERAGQGREQQTRLYSSPTLSALRARRAPPPAAADRARGQACVRSSGCPSVSLPVALNACLSVYTQNRHAFYILHTPYDIVLENQRTYPPFFLRPPTLPKVLISSPIIDPADPNADCAAGRHQHASHRALLLSGARPLLPLPLRGGAGPAGGQAE